MSFNHLGLSGNPQELVRNHDPSSAHHHLRAQPVRCMLMLCVTRIAQTEAKSLKQPLVAVADEEIYPLPRRQSVLD
jgi:hypothetical protein